ncbi:Oxaloacetate decarboxylase, gamma chain [Marinitoga hydrogenitolerans DSM 16785]|uniref:Oxaloacetate decarboxylase, gamma chain n=1 Tax=Marinitoga hydrogenitolerans (strain DSM 16785 / JCM 12826 / AT1271) TaxID=1122195 RepID=A0A1M4YSL6_MARH1|nr:OadG family protein [Marinitoga hydrogenitolerans]SHF08713.1 Oxaloacetate decarboxylase, gamma chain [Marinitoga hydrogenitolerans DSM 16785]
MSNVLSITFVGIVIVFAVLSILSIFFILFKFISPSNEKKVKREINIPHSNPKPINNFKVINGIEETNENEEVISAIMGAVSVYMNGKQFKIKNIKPAPINKNKKLSMWGMLPSTTIWRAKRLGGRK